MKILVVNAGSSSLKYQLIDMDTESVEAKGCCERIALPNSVLKHATEKGVTEIKEDMPNHKVAVRLVLNALVDKEIGVISGMDEIGAVGHRVVHSGEDYTGSVIIDDKVMEVCAKNAELAPLHVPANIIGIQACQEVMPDTPMVAVFDTAFHSTMPDYAYMYAIPYEDYKELKVRRYGFHGTSHKFVSEEAAKFMGKDIKDLKIVTCHLGNGSSITAVDGGKSVDTSMGFTPLEGLPMGTRSGDIDPAAVEFLAGKKGMTLAETVTYLNKKSGVMGVSGVSSDFRDLTAAANEGNHKARLALDIFNYSCKKFVGAYAAAMGGLHCLVFTAGVGENTPASRAAIASGLEFMGVKVDLEKNLEKNNGIIRDITGEGSKVKVLIIPTNEELVIARETLALVK